MDKVYDGIMGLVVGDALGVPFEFKKRDTFKVEGMTGYGTHNQPLGTWSDDSSMTLATLDALLHTGHRINYKFIMDNFTSWLQRGFFTPNEKVFDVGHTTRVAIQKYVNGAELMKCGGTKFTDNGNGALMRSLPLAFINCTIDEIENVSALTHAHTISKRACVIYVDIAKNIIAGMTPKDAIASAMTFYMCDEFSNIYRIETLSRAKIKSTGYVVDTLEAALWCLLTTDNYKDCILTAVNLGDDTDTIAAVAGGLAGIAYGTGKKGIPSEWIDVVQKKRYIESLCNDFEKVEN